MIFYALLLLLLLSRFSRVRLFATPWNVAHQAPPFMGFSRQEYWSGLPFPSGDLPDPGIEPRSPALQADTGRCFNLWATREAPILMRREKTGIQHRTVKALTLELNLAQFSRSVMSNSLRPHELQQARLPCPPPTPRAYSNSCPCVGDAIQPSHPLWSPSPPAFYLSQHQNLFQRVGSSHQVAKVLEFQPQHQSFQWIFRTDFLYDWLVGSPCSP